MGYIYKITNKINGKCYIGQTTMLDINERWKSHLKKRSNCVYLKNAFNKYRPVNFKFEVVCICFDDDCNRYEEEYIKKFESIVPGGYNIKAGGNNGGKHHQETKKKISDTLKLFNKNTTPEYREAHIKKLTGPLNPRWGKKMPQEQKEKMSKKIKERWALGLYDHTKAGRLAILSKANESKKRKVEKYNLQGDLIDTYDSICDSAKSINATASAVSKCCNKRTKTCKGFVFSFK